MRWLLSIVFLLATIAKGFATGEIISMTVQSNGWDVLMVVSNMNTNGVYNFGWSGEPTCALATNVVTGSEKVKFYVNSPGYDSTGALVTNQWAMWGTHEVYKPLTNVVVDESYDGTNVTLHFGVSDYIGSNDTVTVDIGGALYTQGGNTNKATNGLVVINNSTLPYGKVVGNWTWPGWERMTSTNYTARLWAVHEGAHQGLTVPCVKVIARDQNSHAVTNTLTQMSEPDLTLGDAIAAAEFRTVLNLSTLTDTNLVRFDFIAYPWRGFASECIDTTLDTYHLPTPYACALTNVYDPSNHWGLTIAVVDGIGPDSQGLASATNSDPTALDSHIYFSSISKAATAIAATNLAKWNRNAGDGIIYVKGNTEYCSNAAVSLGARASTWLIITNYPGSQYTISNNAANSSSQPSMVKFDGVKIAPGASANNIFFGASNKWLGMWFHNVTLSSSNSTVISDSGSVDNYSLIYVTECNVTNWRQGFVPQGGSLKVCHALLRGNMLDGFNNGIRPFAMLGNGHFTTNGAGYAIAMDAAGMGTPNADQYAFIYDNFFGGMMEAPAGNCLLMNQSFDVSNGVAIVQNILEHCTNNGSSATFDFGSNNSRNYTNMIYWGNVVVGTKTFFAYNETGSVPAWRIRWSIKNNIIDDWNTKGYEFTGGTGANSARIGNLSVRYGCAMSGNTLLETGQGGNPPGLGAPGSFLLMFCGLNTISTNVTANGNGFTNSPSFAQFFDREAYDGISGGRFPGNGNYRLLTSSPLHNLKQDILMPYGIDGGVRGQGVRNVTTFDPPGPYTAGGPRKGGMF